jgi:hypothetical protein
MIHNYLQVAYGEDRRSGVKLKLHLFDLLWICCELVKQQVAGLVKSCGFVLQLVVEPTAQTPLVRFVVDLLWMFCPTCCSTQIKQVELELK